MSDHYLEIIGAFKRGQAVEYRTNGGEWRNVLSGHTWDFVAYQYRIKPDAESHDDYVLRIVTAKKDGKQIQRRSGPKHQWEDVAADSVWNFTTFEYRIKSREWWLNVYGCKSCYRHDSKEAADRVGDGRIECVHVVEVK